MRVAIGEWWGGSREGDGRIESSVWTVESGEVRIEREMGRGVGEWRVEGRIGRGGGRTESGD